MSTGSPQRRRSSVNVGFQENAANFIKQEINYQQWDHSIQESDAEVLRKFLRKQAEGEYDELKIRLTTLEGEAEDIKKHLETFQAAAAQLRETAQQYVERKNEEKALQKAEADSKESTNQQIDKQKAAITATQDKRRDLMNDKNKELNGCTVANFGILLTKARSGDQIAKFLLETLAVFINNADGKRDWSSLLQGPLKDLSAFQLAMRSAEGTNLSKEELDGIRTRIEGTDNEKDRSGWGDIFTAITNENQVDFNAPIFPYYRVVSKTYHHIATTRKMQRHQEKLKAFVDEFKNVDVKVQAHEEKIKALAVFDQLADEANHIEENECEFFRQKMSAVQAEIDEIRQKLAGENFANEYFEV